MFAFLTFFYLACSALIGYTAHLIHESPKYGPSAAAPIWVVFSIVVTTTIVTAVLGLINLGRNNG